MKKLLFIPAALLLITSCSEPTTEAIEEIGLTKIEESTAPEMQLNDGELWLVIASSQHFLCQRHTNTIGDTLTQWASGRFDTQLQLILRMAGRLGTQLTEILQFLDA